MDAAAERQVAARALAAEVEVGRGRAPLALVAVRRAEQREDQLAGADLLAGDLDVGGGDAARHLHGAVVAQQLVHGVGVERRVGDEPLELVAVAQQGERAVADEVHGRLVAGQVQQHDLVAQLDGGQAVAVLLGGDHAAEQVVGRVAPLPLDGVVDVGEHLVGGGDDAAQVGLVGERLERAGHLVRPGAELVAVAVGHAQQLADDDERQREGEAGEEVDRLAGAVSAGDVVEQLGHEDTGSFAEPLDPADGEGARHQAAQPGVVGRVEAQDRAAALAVAAPRGPRARAGRRCWWRCARRRWSRPSRNSSKQSS